MSDMHRALICADILLEIVEQVASDSKLTRRRRNLASMARVNKAFFLPAVRTLWANMTGLGPPFKILSVCVETDYPPGSDLKQYRYALTGEVHDDEWTRFQLYASLIRALELGHRQAFTMEPSSLQYLSSRARRPLFPSLLQLSWSVSPPYHVEPMLFLSPTLRSLKIIFPSPAQVPVDQWRCGIRMTFHNTFLAVPNLRHLELTCEANHQGLLSHEATLRSITEALSWITLLQALKSFVIKDMPMAVDNSKLIHALSTLPHLAKLECYVNIKPETWKSATSGFKSLRTLGTYDLQHAAVLTLFKESCVLQELTIQQHTASTDAVCLQTAQLVGQHFRSLEKLTWKVDLAGDDLADEDGLARLLDPVINLPCLTDLCLRLPRMVICDEDITLIAEMCSQLLKLDLRYRRRSPPTSRALLAFAQHCPALTSLYLDAISMSEVDYAQVDCVPILNHSLQSLSIRELRCKNDRFCAMVIDRLFPRLNIEVPSKISMNSSRTSLPATVLEHIKSFQHVRSQERWRASNDLLARAVER